MIKNEYVKQSEFEVVTVEQLVPEDHILRKVEEQIDFSFARQRLEPLYCKDHGRPAIDPVMLFKMLLIGYMFGIRSERQLVREIAVNVAYRWFLHLNLTDKVPHHSTISQNRIRRFDGTDVFRQIFDDLVLMAYRQGYIEGKVLYTDSTHLKANANKKKFTRKIVAQNTRAYLDELDQAVNEDREDHGKKPFPPKDPPAPETKEIKVSTTDPESGYMCRTNKPEGFFYLDHRTTDDKHNLVTDVHLTPGNASDSQVYLERLDHQLERFGFEVEAVGLDAGYSTPHICESLVKREIFGVISYRKPGGGKGLIRKSQFTYDAAADCYRCPQGNILRYYTTTRGGFREYISDPAQCASCPLLHNCTRSKDHQRMVARHVWDDSVEQIKANRLSERGEQIKLRRSQNVERSFADAKQLHGYRYARFRGLRKAETQSLMTAIVQNIKKMVNIQIRTDKTPDDGEKKRKTGQNSLYERLFSPILCYFRPILQTLPKFHYFAA
jgi:transposase